MKLAVNNLAANAPFPGKVVPAPGKNRHIPPAYGIKEAIDLIQRLSEMDAGIIMPVVATTLESANVDLTEVISDAQHRELLLESRGITLIQKIEALEAQVSDLSNQIMTINSGLEDTVKVKNLLLLALKTRAGEAHAEVEQLLAEDGTTYEIPVEEQDATFAKFQVTLKY